MKSSEVWTDDLEVPKLNQTRFFFLLVFCFVCLEGLKGFCYICKEVIREMSMVF